MKTSPIRFLLVKCILSSFLVLFILFEPWTIIWQVPSFVTSFTRACPFIQFLFIRVVFTSVWFGFVSGNFSSEKMYFSFNNSKIFCATFCFDAFFLYELSPRQTYVFPSFVIVPLAINGFFEFRNETLYIDSEKIYSIQI